jgi:predicted ester cyclase
MVLLAMFELQRRGAQMNRTMLMCLVGAILIATIGWAGRMTASHEATVRRLIEQGWNSHDPSKLREHYDDSVSFRSPLAGDIRSLEGVQRFAAGIFRAFPDAKMRVTRVVSAGSDVFVHFEASGTNTGPLPNGKDATGRSMSFEGLAHLVIENGKVRQDWVYYDALGLFKQLGLAPED